MSRRVAAALLAVVASACGASGEGDVAPASDLPAAFDGSMPTLERLAEHVVAALVSEDRPALEQVRLTEHEHNEVVWAELPASAPEVNFPLDYAWTNIQNRNARSLGRILPMYGGREIELELVDCRGERARFESFEVLTDCWLVFRLAGQRDLYEAQVFKDVLVRGGGYKIFRYYEEEPRRYASG